MKRSVWMLSVVAALGFGPVSAQPERHWAWIAPRAASGGIDDFVGARLRDAGLTFSPEADRYTLVRRLYLDLIGLPPTLAEADAFVGDATPDAYERVVDRLLASPHFGERMAVPWLDAARYADTNGFSIDDHRDMWAWRDWVIRAFNENVPFDRFLMEQLAGDLLPDATDASRLASGFLRNGMNTHEGGTIPDEYRVTYLADMVDTTSGVFLGLTVRCAQCHDHKYDPVTQKEYYRLYAFFDRAEVRGMGAQNGNTEPVLEVEPPLGGREAALRSAEQRLAALARHRLHPPALVGARRTWEHQAREAATSSPGKGSRLLLPERPPRWIWADKGQHEETVVLERVFLLSARPDAARALLTCDNAAVVRVNEKDVGRADDWTRPIEIDVAELLVVGENRITVEARNAGGPAGLIVLLQMRDAVGRVSHVVSDDGWQVRGGGPAVEVATYGAAPWGPVLDAKLTPRLLDEALRKDEPGRTEEDWRAINTAFGREEPEMVAHVGAIDREVEVVQRLIASGKTSVMVMREGPPRTTWVLTRGQYDLPDESRPVRPGTPKVLPPMGDELPRDRLGLARWLTSPGHPLTGRVAVNRIWQMLFGRGVVATPNDFGTRGARPTHPALLDGLARRFVDQGWNVKALVKRIVMSRTYRQASRATPDRMARDPDNALLSRAPRLRLSAEGVRDGALAIGGLLVRDMGGPSVFPEQPDGLWREVSHFGYAPAFTAQAFYPSVGAGLHRRSLYTFWKRTSPPPALLAFDAPTREVCTMERSRTNTPLQALVLLNAPTFVDAARGLAGLALALDGDTQVRLQWMFRRAVVRPPEGWERDLLEDRLRVARRRFASAPEEARKLAPPDVPEGEMVDRAAWTVVASIILNLDEVISKE